MQTPQVVPQIQCSYALAQILVTNYELSFCRNKKFVLTF